MVFATAVVESESESESELESLEFSDSSESSSSELELELELERTQECESVRSVCGALHTPPSLDVDVDMGERAGDRSGK